MSLIDWSDPHEMLGLLIEYVSDEAIVSVDDTDRTAWLHNLLNDLESVISQDVDAVGQIAHALREIRHSQPREFVADPVMDHLDACIEELHRIEMGSQETTASVV
jgi:folate-binding Fe-S cluster repair protein YgfZ